jgi:membrane protease YdiL (CAAX protease family)
MAEASDKYMEQSRRPLTSLAFLVPLLVLYEGGIIALGADALRNGPEVWLRSLLATLDFGQYFLLPVLIVGSLLVWHHTTGDPWRVSPGVVLAMFVECAVLAFLLLLLAQSQRWFEGRFDAMLPSLRIQAQIDPKEIGKFIGYIGAGIYEEFLFRLMLIPLVSALVGLLASLLRVEGRLQLFKPVIAVLVTSLLFSAAHYIGAESFEWSTFVFRFIAGVFFAVLFLHRGFGIAAGTHAAYDLYTLAFTAG